MEGTNIFDYLKWRGDLSFTKSPFNDVDSLILSQIVYIPFEGVVPSIRNTKTITLREAADKYFAYKSDKTPSLGALLPKEIFSLFRMAADSERFGNLRLGRYINKIDHDTEIQFCVMIVYIDEIKEIYVDFRGTDDTIVGWKEDFNMSIMCPVPSQKESVRYLHNMVLKINLPVDWKIRLGGHSKGGNLAAFAAIYAHEDIQDMIACVYNHDGPGFGEIVIKSKEYQKMKNRIKTTVPQSSVVGMLLGHEENYTVVKSHQIGLLQHDALSWEVIGTGFVQLEKVDEASLLVDKTLKQWLSAMEIEAKETFVTAMFDILNATDAKTLTDLMMGKNKSITAMMKAYAGEDEETKKMLKSAFKAMVEIGRRTIASVMKPTLGVKSLPLYTTEKEAKA